MGWDFQHLQLQSLLQFPQNFLTSHTLLHDGTLLTRPRFHLLITPVSPLTDNDGRQRRPREATSARTIQEQITRVKRMGIQVKSPADGYQRAANKTEDNIKALQSVGQIIGEVLKQLDEERFIVKASSGPRYVVGCRSKVDKEKMKQGTRVALDMTTLTIMRMLPREVDPLVYNMSLEDPGQVSSADSRDVRLRQGARALHHFHGRDRCHRWTTILGRHQCGSRDSENTDGASQPAGRIRLLGQDEDHHGNQQARHT